MVASRSHNESSNVDTAYRIVAAARAALCAWVTLSLLPASSYGDDAMTDDQRAVMDVVTAVFDGMREKDATLIAAQFAEDARLGEMTAAEFAERVSGATAQLDEVTFEETVLVDDDLAMAWTPYNLFVDGNFHHCGVDLFVMQRVDGRWLITQLEDTRRTDGCDASRRE